MNVGSDTEVLVRLRSTESKAAGIWMDLDTGGANSGTENAKPSGWPGCASALFCDPLGEPSDTPRNAASP